MVSTKQIQLINTGARTSVRLNVIASAKIPLFSASDGDDAGEQQKKTSGREKSVRLGAGARNTHSSTAKGTAWKFSGQAHGPAVRAGDS
jgi:hypothetical protein